MLTVLAPVPPMLEAAVEYDGRARYVALYWEPAGDEVMYDDGRTGATGAWDAFLLYKRHPLVAAHLEPYSLGSSDAPAEHWLILDRTTRGLSIAPVAEARRFLRTQWPVVEMQQEISPEELQRLVEAHVERANAMLRRDRAAIMAEVEARMAAHALVMEDLARWLDERLAARESMR